MINKSIFRLYDIRGSSLLDITPNNAYRIGFCFSQLNIIDDNRTILVGRDGRLSSPIIFDSLVKGLIDGGASIISIGIIPTPVLYFADKQLSPIASIMITGSHNPKNDNGFKMMHCGKVFFGEKIQDLLQLILKTDWDNIRPFSILNQTNGSCNIANDVTEEMDMNELYIHRILLDQIVNKDLKIAWDPGNGAACDLIKMLIARLPNDNIIINGEMDGNFPNHHPDPTIAKNLEQLIETVKTHNCDFGIAFDGDADRIGVISKTGNIILGDQLLCLFAKDILNEHKSATIITDVKSSQLIFDQIIQYGGKAIMWKSGHSLIKTKMLETNALLAGEMSGHMFFADKYYGYDDAIYAALRLIDLISRSKDSLENMIAFLPITYNGPEIKILVNDDDKFIIIDQMKQYFIDKAIDFNDIDGIRISNDHGWFLLRASNTEPAIIARYEAKSQAGLKILKANILTILNRYNLN
jgi:phosphomannomutase